jgi:hypothetical protein
VSAGAGVSDRSVAFFTAVVAVLAALGTLFANHISAQTLSVRNDVLLYTQQASDQFAYYQTKQLKAAIDKASRSTAAANEEQRASLGIYGQAKSLEAQAAKEQEHAANLFHAYETVEIATTLFEISIAFASIAALTHVRFTLLAAGVLTAIGIVTAVAGYAQFH